MSIFSILMSLHPDFHSDSTSFHHYLQYLRVPFPPKSMPAFVCFPDDSHSNWGEIESQLYFDLHSFMNKNVKHFLIYLYEEEHSSENYV
jgi:hypothetical protein